MLVAGALSFALNPFLRPIALLCHSSIAATAQLFFFDADAKIVTLKQH